jgi:hypothetical protein
MTTRQRLPDRRPAETFELMAGGLKYICTVSRFADGRIGELFPGNHKINSAADTSARDACHHILDCGSARRRSRNHSQCALSRCRRHCVRSAWRRARSDPRPQMIKAASQMNLADIRKFTAQLTPRILIHGAEGVGKTTIASKFPAPIFLQTEDGCPSGLEVNSFGLIDNFGDLRSAIGALASEQHHYRTVVIDSLDAAEGLIWDDACRSQGWSSIESPGYGKGYVIVESWWIDILKGLDYLRRRIGMSIVLLAHSAIETINDPRAASYTSYQLRVHKRARSLVQDWCDAIGFLAPDLHVQSEEIGFGKKRNRADGGSQRWLHFEARPSFVAKNRYGLPAKMPVPKDFSYGALAPYLPPQPSAVIDGKPDRKPTKQRS